MHKFFVSLILALLSVCAGAFDSSADTRGTQLPPCPVRGSDVVEDHDCMCTKKARRAGGNLHGSGPYLWYSNICLAALHAGVTGPDGGEVRVEIRPPHSS